MIVQKAKSLTYKIFDFKILEIRQAWRAGIICVAGLALNNFYLKTAYPLWILITALVCLQANLGATIIKSKQRVLSTILGCGVAFVLTYFFPENYKLYILVSLVSLIISFHVIISSYTYGNFYLTLSAMMIYFSIFSNGAQLALLRIEDVFWGALLGSFGLLFLWPEFARNNFPKDLFNLKEKLDYFFKSVLEWLEQPEKTEPVTEKKIACSECIQITRSRLTEIFYEISLKKFPTTEFEAILFSLTRIHYSLISLFNALRVEAHSDEKEFLILYKPELYLLYRYFRTVINKIPSANEKKEDEQVPLCLNDDFIINIKTKFQAHSKVYSFLCNIFEEIKTIEKEIDLFFIKNNPKK